MRLKRRMKRGIMLMGLCLVLGTGMIANAAQTGTNTTTGGSTANTNGSTTNTDNGGTTGGNTTNDNKNNDTKNNAQTNPNAVRNGWQRNYTMFYKNGRPVTGPNYINGKLYFFNGSGFLCRLKGFRVLYGRGYYFNDDSTLRTGLVRIGSKTYYFLKLNGQLVTGGGVKYVDRAFYKFNADNSLSTGWYRNNGQRYYFSPKTYTLVTGWNYINGYKYYFNTRGQLLQDLRGTRMVRKNGDYLIKVNRSASCVTVYMRDGKNGYIIPVVSFVCSAGWGTPLGTFHTGAKLRWHELMGPCWGQWCTKITSDILFHSVYYNEKNNNRTLNVAAYNKLGTVASHGCVRLTCGDCKWLYDYCKTGTTVVIYDNAKNPGPFDKPTAQKLNSNHTWDPTDPAFR